MTKLTDDILDLSKMKAGAFELSPKPFELSQLVEEITYVFEGQCEQKGIGFKFNCSEDIQNQFFSSDINRIKQVLLNFISNAYKFTCLGNINVSMFFLTDEAISPFKPRKLMF
jgi:signal transduction histidine kinase